MNTIKESIHQFSVLTAHHEAVELQELILIPSEYNGLTKKKDNWNPISHVIIKQLRRQKKKTIGTLSHTLSSNS